MHHLFFKHTTPRWIIWCCSDKRRKCAKLYSTYLSWKWDCKFLLALFELIVLHWHRDCFITHVLKMVSCVVSRVLWAGSQTVWVCVVKLKLAHSVGSPFPTVEYYLHPLGAFWRQEPAFQWVFPEVDILRLWYMRVVLLKKCARTSQYCCMFHIFCVCTVYSLMSSLILHEMTLLLHENWSYCIQHVWCLCKLQNKNFIMVCCTTLWRATWSWEREGVKHSYCNWLLAAVSVWP